MGNVLTKASQKTRNEINALKEVFREPLAGRKAQFLFRKAAALESAARRVDPSDHTGVGPFSEAAKLYVAAAMGFMKAGNAAEAAESFERSSNVLVDMSKSDQNADHRFYHLYLAGRNYAYASYLRSRAAPGSGNGAEDKGRKCFAQIDLSENRFSEELRESKIFVHSLMDEKM